MLGELLQILKLLCLRAFRGGSLQIRDTWELMEYDFELEHISGKKNGRADALSRRPDHDTGEEDNKQLVVLPPRFFAEVQA
jgi:hypothetical protein